MEKALSELLSEQEIKDVAKILALPEDEIIEELKTYLNERVEKLEAQGVLPDYLAYVLYAKSQNII